MVSTGEVTGSSLMGAVLGKDYRVLQQIGRGGMAVVYLVEHETLRKKFAAKVLSAEHAMNEEARARFTQEAHAASQLDHENIVTISDFGVTTDGRPFYVMELLRGRTLMDRLEEGPMTLEEVVAVSVPIARALAHAHSEGVIHRDVKPENVFLVQRTQNRWGVKVLDFGIAKVTTNPSLTKMGQALGSPMFMAPEACRGDDVDARADLYSFGVVLYLMLTGKVPFSDESLLKILQMQVTNPVPPMREHKPEISEELEAVVMRALQKRPEDRYPTMDAMLLDLQLVLPEGSDALLQLAQFGTALTDTPFPGQSLRMIAMSSQRLMVGDKDASTQLEPSSSARFPVAPPPRRRRSALILGIAIPVLALGGGAAYWLSTNGDRQAEAQPPVATRPVTPETKPAAPPAPVVVEPAPAESVARPSEPVAAPSEPVAAPTEPVAKVIEPVKPAVAAVRPPVAAKRPPVVVAAIKPPPTKTPAKTVPAKPDKITKSDPTKLDTKPAQSSSTVTEPPVETRPPSGSATPPEQPRQPSAGSATPKPPTPTVVGSLDAKPSIGSLDVSGPLPSSVVRRSVERALPAMRTCYRTAAKAKGTTPATTISLSFEVDESAALTGVSARGGGQLTTLAGCVRDAIARLQTQQAPDVGTVNVVITVTFQPI